MFERITSMLVKEFLQVLRDPRMRTVIIIGPLVQIVLFGYAANTDIQNIPTAVYDLDNTKESRELVRSFRYSRYFNINYYIQDDASVKDLIDRSKVMLVIRFNRGFGRDIQGNKAAPVQLIFDGTDSNTAGIVLGYANTIVAEYASRVFQDRKRIFLKKDVSYPTVDLRDRPWFNDNLESKNYYIPGVMASIVTIVTFLLTSMAIVREKEIGTMDQIIVSPLRPGELIAGKILPFAVIALLDIMLIIMLGVFWFQIPVRGSLLVLLVGTVIFLLTSLGVGLFISTVSSTQQEAMMSTFLIFFPMNLLSGFMFPINNMPKIIQHITALNPLRYYMVIIRAIFLKGVGVRVLWQEMLILLVMGITVLSFSSVVFRKRLG
jgi:ABC-2 type transport system permease protein